MSLILGKVWSHRTPNLGCSRAESPGWFDVSPKNSAPDEMHEWARCHDEAANHQLSRRPVVAFWIIQIVSTGQCLSLMQNLMQIHWFTRSVILNAMETQYTHSLNGVYHPHWPWSCHCSRMCVPVHSPWLPGYVDVTQTILVILTVAGLFLDRVHMLSMKPSARRFKDILYKHIKVPCKEDIISFT